MQSFIHSHSKMKNKVLCIHICIHLKSKLNRILCMHLCILFQLKLKNKIEFYTFIHAFSYENKKKIKIEFLCILIFKK